ncbi:MAG: type VII secretion protein EssC, partial [Lachnospiraceae bacterium]
ALILPSLGMMCITVAVSILMRRGLFIMISVAGTGITMITSTIKYITDKKEYKEEKKLRNVTYRKYLLKKRKEIYEAYKKEHDVCWYLNPNLEEIENMIHSYSERIYERRVQDDDFLAVAVGSADMPCSFRIKMPTEEIESRKDELWEEATQIKREFSKMTQPVVIDLKKAHLGLVGEKKVIHEQLKRILAQITFFHSYHDVEIVCIYNKMYEDDFNWMRWYPHFRIHAINAIATINSERKRDQILGSLHQILRERKLKVEESKKESIFLPHFIFVIDEPKLILNHSIMEYLAQSGEELGFSIIYTTGMRANLPENIETIFVLNNSEQATLLIEEREEKNLSLTISNTKGLDLEWMARDLGTLEHLQGISAQIPESMTFFEMYEIEHPEQIDAETRWNQNRSAKSMAVPLGARAKEDLVYLNLHEKAHGPHGLVAGTTGSGKSEIIQTYILSLSVNFHPHEVAFLLIDYKGGGMAGLFKKLPHLLGTITNLDGAQSMRAMASIKSELARRQRIFSSHDVNHINQYQKLFHQGSAEEPLPHLFIISDEFAELKKEQPEFMSELVSAARIGRSLGVHLILATQKPSGVVDDQIWTNSKFRLALMVQNESDSKEILKTPDAANISTPGRAYLQVGNNEIYELFQSAWSGATYQMEGEKEQADDRVYLVNDLGQGELVNQELDEDSENSGLVITQLDAIVSYLHRVNTQLKLVKVKAPWLPPLGENLLSPQELMRAGEQPTADLLVTIGLLDIPEEQKQCSYNIDLAKDGNLLYVASPGFGKTVFLTTVLLSIAMKNCVDSVNFYILDFGNSGLIPLRQLSHTADYIAFDDTERMQKLQSILSIEMKERKKLLADRMVQNFKVYNSVSETPMKAIVLAIDNFDAAKELGYNAEEFFMKLSRDGSGLGIYLVATATRSGAMKYSTYNNFKNKIAGFMFDDNDVSLVVGRSTYKPSEIKGRALVKMEGVISVLQIFQMAKGVTEVEYNQGIEEKIIEINQSYPGKKAPRIPVLPEHLTSSTLFEYEQMPAAIYLGLETESVKCTGFDRDMSPFVILGESSRGKTNAVRIILEQISGSGKIYLFDSAAMELYAYKDAEGITYVESAAEIEHFMSALTEEIGTRNKRIMEMLNTDPGRHPREIGKELPPLYIIADDWDQFVEKTKVNTVQIASLLAACKGVGISVILSAHSGKMKGFDEVTKYAKSATDGLLIGTQGTTGMFGLSTIKELPQPKDGLLFHNGGYIRIRVAAAVKNERSDV